MRLRFLGLSAILVLVPPLFGQQHQQIVEDSHSGFDKQYKTIFTAFRKADERELRLRFNDFTIPQHWFTDVFGSDSGSKLADRYAQEFEKFKYSTVNLFEGVDIVQFSTVGTHVWKFDEQANPAPWRPPPSLLPMPSVKYFKIDYGRSGYTGQEVYGGPEVVLDWGSNAVWKGSFIYVDGAFRFFGMQGYPFWDLKDDEPAGFCADLRVQGGQVVNKVPPVYPVDAKRKHIGGVVLMNVTVAKDGSVKQVGIVSGNPLLWDAAQQAVMQWHYFPPFRKCSQPVENTSRQFVKFPSH
jgi:TonB family protein